MKTVKRISSYILIIALFLSSLLLTGCVDEESTSSFLDGIKLTYSSTKLYDGTLGYDNTTEFYDDYYDNMSMLSNEVLYSIMAQYGLGVSDGTTVAIGYDSIFENIVPFGSVSQGTYTPTEYTTHKDAINVSHKSGANTYSWNWKSSGVFDLVIQYINDYFDHHSDKMLIAIMLINQGYDISSTSGADYDIYLDAIESQDTQTIITELYDKSNIDHFGLTLYEINQLKQFILNVVIGSDLVEYDSNNFLDSNLNGIFDCEEYIVGNGDIYHDLNENAQFDSGIESGALDERQNYFKNYAKVINSIIDKIFNFVDSDVVRYPNFSCLNIKDFTLSQISSVVENGDLNSFVIPSGAQLYNSVIFMNNSSVQYKSIVLDLKSDTDLILDVYLRAYSKADDEILFSGLADSVNIEGGSSGNNIIVEVEDLIKSIRPMLIDEAFDNDLSIQANEMISLNLDNLNYANNFDTISLNNVDKSVVFADTTNDYIELVFVPQSMAVFEFGFILINADYGSDLL